MQAIEFDTDMLPAGQIALPAYFANQIPMGQQVRVIVMWEPRAFDPEDTVGDQGYNDSTRR